MSVFHGGSPRATATCELISSFGKDRPGVGRPGRPSILGSVFCPRPTRRHFSLHSFPSTVERTAIILNLHRAQSKGRTVSSRLHDTRLMNNLVKVRKEYQTARKRGDGPNIWNSAAESKGRSAPPVFPASTDQTRREYSLNLLQSALAKDNRRF